MAGGHEEGGPELMQDAQLLEVAKRVGRSPQQMCIRCQLQCHPGLAAGEVAPAAPNVQPADVFRGQQAIDDRRC
jgi:hypothetical protein